MKRKLILAALALLMASSAASAFTKEQSDVISVATMALLAGLDDHCPRYRLNNDAMISELIASGLTEKDFDSGEMSDERDRAILPFMLDYKSNPSRFCDAAWQALGPNGTYKRQMLEAK